MITLTKRFQDDPEWQEICQSLDKYAEILDKRLKITHHREGVYPAQARELASVWRNARQLEVKDVPFLREAVSELSLSCWERGDDRSVSNIEYGCLYATILRRFVQKIDVFFERYGIQTVNRQETITTYNNFLKPQDALAYHIQDDAAYFAIADGVSGSSESELVSNPIVEQFCQRQFLTEKSLSSADEQFLASLAQPGKSAKSTFIGLKVCPPNQDETGRFEFKGCGDSTLFHVRKAQQNDGKVDYRLIQQFPREEDFIMEDREQNAPAQIGFYEDGRLKVRPIDHFEGEYIQEDVFILATDEVASLIGAKLKGLIIREKRRTFPEDPEPDFQILIENTGTIDSRFYINSFNKPRDDDALIVVPVCSIWHPKAPHPKQELVVSSATKNTQLEKLVQWWHKRSQELGITTANTPVTTIASPPATVLVSPPSAPVTLSPSTLPTPDESVSTWQELCQRVQTFVRLMCRAFGLDHTKLNADAPRTEEKSLARIQQAFDPDQPKNEPLAWASLKSGATLLNQLCLSNSVSRDTVNELEQTQHDINSAAQAHGVATKDPMWNQPFAASSFATSFTPPAPVSPAAAPPIVLPSPSPASPSMGSGSSGAGQPSVPVSPTPPVNKGTATASPSPPASSPSSPTPPNVQVVDVTSRSDTSSTPWYKSKKFWTAAAIGAGCLAVAGVAYMLSQSGQHPPPMADMPDPTPPPPDIPTPTPPASSELPAWLKTAGEGLEQGKGLSSDTLKSLETLRSEDIQAIVRDHPETASSVNHWLETHLQGQQKLETLYNNQTFRALRDAGGVAMGEYTPTDPDATLRFINDTFARHGVEVRFDKLAEAQEYIRRESNSQYAAIDKVLGMQEGTSYGQFDATYATIKDDSIYEHLKEGWQGQQDSLKKLQEAIGQGFKDTSVAPPESLGEGVLIASTVSDMPMPILPAPDHRAMLTAAGMSLGTGIARSAIGHAVPVVGAALATYAISKRSFDHLWNKAEKLGIVEERAGARLVERLTHAPHDMGRILHQTAKDTPDDFQNMVRQVANMSKNLLHMTMNFFHKPKQTDDLAALVAPKFKER